MDKELFAHMQEQLMPGPEVLDALEKRLEGEAARKRTPWGRYMALAACAVLVLAAVPLYTALNPPLHAYALGEAVPARQELALGTGDLGGGIDGTHPVLPGGAVLVERPVQEEATAAYEALMARFAADLGAGSYPGWYGGAYIDDWGGLIVCVVGAPEGDKSLYLDIQAMCDGHPVGFRDVGYTLSHLNALQDQVVALLDGLDFEGGRWASGVDEEGNRVAVTLPFASKKALAGLHKLDPAGDAIAVTVVEHGDPLPGEPGQTEEPTMHPIDPAPAATQPIQDLPGELPVPEPAEESDAPAHYDLLEEPGQVRDLPAELPERKLPRLEERPAQTSQAPVN